MKFTIGSDPEVALSSQITGRVVSAETFYHDHVGDSDDEHDCSVCHRAEHRCENCGENESYCECNEDDQDVRVHACEDYEYNGRCPMSTNAYSAPFGCDGASDTAEFRPEPATDPETAAQNCITLVRDSVYLLEDNEVDAWAGGSAKNQTLGGHIHFGVPYDRGVIAPLDAFVGAPLHQVCPVEETRSRGGYASFGAIETKPYGFEYRTPPSWLVAPWLVRAVHHISWHVMRQHLAGTLPESFPMDNGMLYPRDSLCNPSQFDAIKLAWAPAFKSCPGPVAHLWGLIVGQDYWQTHEPINPHWLEQEGTPHTAPAKAPLYQSGKADVVISPSQDEFVSNIVSYTHVNDYVKARLRGITVYVYGVRTSRGDEVWVSRGLQLRSETIKRLRSQYGVGIKRGRHGGAKTHKYAIGLPYRIRENPRNAADIVYMLIEAARPRKRRKK